MKAQVPEKINRDLIEQAENISRNKGNGDLAIFVDTVGTTLNLVMDQLDAIIDYLKAKEEDQKEAEYKKFLRENKKQGKIVQLLN